MMKQIKFFIIILLVSATALTGCEYGAKKSIEKPIKDFLTLYYTIDNYSSYKIIIEESSKKESSQEYKDTILKAQEKFKPYLTENSFNTLVASRMYLLYLKDAYDKKYTAKVKNITIEKTTEEKNLIVYKYTANITQINENGKMTTSKHEGEIQAYKQEDNWKLKFLPNE